MPTNNLHVATCTYVINQLNLLTPYECQCYHRLVVANSMVGYHRTAEGTYYFRACLLADVHCGGALFGFLPSRISAAGKRIHSVARCADFLHILGSQLNIVRGCVLFEVFDLLGSNATISDLIWWKSWIINQ